MKVVAVEEVYRAASSRLEMSTLISAVFFLVDETGLVWVECACKRWLHEDCIDYDSVVNINGQELLCPLCVS